MKFHVYNVKKNVKQYYTLFMAIHRYKVKNSKNIEEND